MNEPRTPVESLRKGLMLLEALCDIGRDGAALGDVAQRMGWKRTTTHNLIKTLSLCGYALNDGEGRYTAGWKVLDLTRRLTAAGALRPELVQALAGLAAELDEAVVLTTITDSHRRILARARGTQAVQVDALALENGKIRIWETVTGRILAAFCSPMERDVLVQREGLPIDTWQGLSTRAALETELARLRSSQLAESHAREVASFARPILTSTGEALGAIGVHLPEYRCDSTVRNSILNALARTTERMAALWSAQFASTENTGV